MFSSNAQKNNASRSSVIKENPQFNRTAHKEDSPHEKMSTQDLSFCLICKTTISFEERRLLIDIQYHYTLCLWRENKFEAICPRINEDDNARQYRCRLQGCSQRTMKYREFCIHEGIAHRRTQALLACDPRPGLQAVSACFALPMKKYIGQ